MTDDFVPPTRLNFSDAAWRLFNRECMVRQMAVHIREREKLNVEWRLQNEPSKAAMNHAAELEAIGNTLRILQIDTESFSVLMRMAEYDPAALKRLVEGARQ
jgi:hypothetical protein